MNGFPGCRTRFVQSGLIHNPESEKKPSASHLKKCKRIFSLQIVIGIPKKTRETKLFVPGEN